MRGASFLGSRMLGINAWRVAIDSATSFHSTEAYLPTWHAVDIGDARLGAEIDTSEFADLDPSSGIAYGLDEAVPRAGMDERVRQNIERAMHPLTGLSVVQRESTIDLPVVSDGELRTLSPGGVYLVRMHLPRSGTGDLSRQIDAGTAVLAPEGGAAQPQRDPSLAVHLTLAPMGSFSPFKTLGPISPLH